MLASGAGAEVLRIAVFHTELERDGPGLLLRDVLSEKDAQVEAVLRVLRAADADVLVLAGIDYDLEGVALGAFADRIGGYTYRFQNAPNRGLPSGADLNRNGRLGDPEDAIGFADFRGQGGLAVLSRLPLDKDGVRVFTAFPWRDLPGNLALPETPPDFPLSTTVHWDVPVQLGDGEMLHLWIWHATPPVFDGPEDRNGRRNHDEAAFWLRYLDGNLGVDAPERFVLAGFANLDVIDGDGRSEALGALLSDPRIKDPAPESDGGVLASDADGGVNAGHRGDPALDTADWEDGPGRPGNLRVDYLLPAASLGLKEAGLFWPAPESSLGGDVERASRHRLIWVDVEVPDGAGEGG